MIENAQDLYNYFISKYSLDEKILCDLHIPCKKNRECKNPQEVKKLIDFDNVMTIFSSENGKTTEPSVDGFSYIGEYLLLVEIKGWKKYFQFTKDISEQKIKEQVNSYNLSGKFVNSIDICFSTNQDLDFWKNMGIIYVLITDIDVTESKKNPLAKFSANLNQLAQTSSSLEKICNETFQKHINNSEITIKEQVKNIKFVRTYYKSCREFEDFLKKFDAFAL